MSTTAKQDSSCFANTSVQESLQGNITSQERHHLRAVWLKVKAEASHTGIFVDWKWRGCFDIFLAAALASGARKGLSIELIDPEVGYIPGNVRWVAHPSHARRDNVFLVAFGESHIPVEWAESEHAGEGVTASHIHSRIALGWEPERAITTPVKKYKPRVLAEVSV